jgi:putative sigma-54 modulation protein
MPVQINISARHGQLSPATQEKISEKVEKLRRYFDRMTSIQVTVDLEHRESPDVEVRVSAEHTDDFVATATGELIAALDGVLHKIETQIRRYKDKRTGHRASGHKHLELPVEGEAEEI